MNLGVGISFYNDVEGMRRLLSSLDVPEVEKVIAIDGRYPRFRSDSELSNDGSREVCKEFRNTVLVDYSASEVKKRNKYLQLSKQYGLDFIMILDSDEYIKEQKGYEQNSWPTFLYGCEQSVKLDLGLYRIYDVRFEEENGWDMGERPRLWYRPWEIRYDVKHYRWIIKVKCLDRQVYEGNAGRRLIPGIVMAHGRSIRPAERNKNMDDYKDWLMSHEIEQMRIKYHLP